jgi:hypothetical protein
MTATNKYALSFFIVLIPAKLSHFLTGQSELPKSYEPK